MSELLRSSRVTGSPEIVQVASATTLEARSQVVHIQTASGAFTVTLPNVTKAIGVMIILNKTDASINAATIAHGGGSEGWTNLTMDAQNDKAVLISDGVAWHILNNIA